MLVVEHVIVIAIFFSKLVATLKKPVARQKQPEKIRELGTLLNWKKPPVLCLLQIQWTRKVKRNHLKTNKSMRIALSQRLAPHMLSANNTQKHRFSWHFFLTPINQSQRKRVLHNRTRQWALDSIRWYRKGISHVVSSGQTAKKIECKMVKRMGKKCVAWNFNRVTLRC